MPYVQREPPGSGQIVGLYNTMQPGIAEEFLPDDNIEVQQFLNPQKTLLSSSDFIARFTNAEYLALEKKRRDDFVANKVGNAKNWDVVVSEDMINLTNQKSATLKSALISDGILTQARADAIFS